MRNGCFLLRIRGARNIDILAHLFAISIAQNVVLFLPTQRRIQGAMGFSPPRTVKSWFS